jgi:DNA-binding response OmpR family regulator
MPKKILILEDDEPTAELMKFYMQEEGFQVAVFPRGTNFLLKAAEYQPDLITLDVLLPDADGFSIFKNLQQDERTRNIPVVFVTVREDKEIGLKMGARGYIMKPFSERELKGTIKSILGQEMWHEKNSHCR